MVKNYSHIIIFINSLFIDKNQNKILNNFKSKYI